MCSPNISGLPVNPSRAPAAASRPTVGTTVPSQIFQNTNFSVRSSGVPLPVPMFRQEPIEEKMDIAEGIPSMPVVRPVQDRLIFVCGSTSMRQFEPALPRPSAPVAPAVPAALAQLRGIKREILRELQDESTRKKTERSELLTHLVNS